MCGLRNINRERGAGMLVNRKRGDILSRLAREGSTEKVASDHRPDHVENGQRTRDPLRDRKAASVDVRLGLCGRSRRALPVAQGPGTCASFTGPVCVHVNERFTGGE